MAFLDRVEVVERSEINARDHRLYMTWLSVSKERCLKV